ncbi:Transposase [Marinobacterium lacunae]|uniref:Transposase n=1 Tax=Marinobacterium lacunae TaxID=1232683 RepID=A0A081FWT3_9GAMM|nr:Transposase [Marinobacterium lacunae]
MRHWAHEDEMESMKRRLQAAPDTMLIRKSTVEHPFGTIKVWMGSTHFLTRRFKNVSTEMGVHVLAYNLKRMLSILGPKNLLIALKE